MPVIFCIHFTSVDGEERDIFRGDCHCYFLFSILLKKCYGGEGMELYTNFPCKNKWDEMKNCANIYINPKLCVFNYKGGRNTAKIPLAIIHVAFFLATFQVQSPQRLQCNLLTSWVRTMWLFGIKRILNVIVQRLCWKNTEKKIHSSCGTSAYVSQ